MNLTEEQVIELFEEFLDENYYVDMLTEEDLDYVFENEFPQWLEEGYGKAIGRFAKWVSGSKNNKATTGKRPYAGPLPEPYAGPLSKPTAAGGPPTTGGPAYRGPLSKPTAASGPPTTGGPAYRGLLPEPPLTGGRPYFGPLPPRSTTPVKKPKPKTEEVQFTEEEQVIELFEEFLDENYYVGELTEANILWVYEEEFLPALEQQIEESAGCDCENCQCENCQCENVQEEQQISPKMQAYLNEMSKKGTKSIEHGGDGATTRRDVMIAILQSKKKKSGLSMKEEDLLAKLIAAEEKEDSGKKK